MVRVPNALGPGLDRLVVGYNDYQDATYFSMIEDGFAPVPGASRMGWAYSDTLGGSWIAGTQITPGANLPAGTTLFGDPNLAQTNGTVLYVGLAQLSGRVSDIVLSRWRPGQAGFQPALSIYHGSDAEIETVDGPKIGVEQTGANPRAVITFMRGTTMSPRAPLGFVVLETLGEMSEPLEVQRGTLLFPGVHFPAPCNVGISPSSNSYSPHPTLVVGRHGFAYIAVRNSFTYPPPCELKQERIEIYRANLHLLPIMWERIMSLPAPPPRDGRLLTSIPNEVSRQGIALSIGLAQSGGHDVVGVAVENLTSNGSPPATINDQRIRFIRRADADTCVVVNELDGCADAVESDPELSYQASVTIGGTPVALNAPRVGVQRVQPSIVSSPADDGRMAIYWYAQPWRYWNLASLPNRRHRFLTTVEGLVSENAGASWGPLKRIAVFNYSTLEFYDAGVQDVPTLEDGDGAIPDVSSTAYDRGSGLMFEPCLFQVRTAAMAVPEDRFYFGDYQGGTFLGSTASDLRVYSNWSDSRNGCVQRTNGYRSPVMHQHVFGGQW